MANNTTLPEPTALLDRVSQLLHQGDPRAALEHLGRTKDTSPWVVNARAVCLLRLGDAQRAVELLRGVVLGAGGFGLKEDAPAAFKTNYATAQLLAGNLTGCIVTLAQARDEGHPAVRRLRDALRQRRSRLSFWEKVRSFLGSDVGGPVELDFPPGDL